LDLADAEARALNETHRPGSAWEKEFARTMVSKPRSSKKSLPALGLLLAASLALGIGVVAPASALAAAPVNTSLPVVSPAKPHPGVVETTTNGTWTGSPTSYTYSWSRCDALGGSCASIAGATSVTYTPVKADAGHTLVAAVTAHNSEGGSSPARSAPTELVDWGYWYSCQNVGAGAGFYEDPACSKEGGSKAFAWTKLGATPTGLTMHREGPGTTGEFVINFKPFGSEVRIECETQAASGTIANPAGGAAGTTSLSSFTLSGCSVLFAGGCKVHEPVTFNSLTGHMTEFSGKTALEFASTNPEQLTNVEFIGTSCSVKGISYPVTGSFTGVVDAVASTLTITNASSNMFSVHRPATMSGVATLATTAGEAVKIAN
jgi:hypothetical protein